MRMTIWRGIMANATKTLAAAILTTGLVLTLIFALESGAVSAADPLPPVVEPEPVEMPALAPTAPPMPQKPLGVLTKPDESFTPEYADLARKLGVQYDHGPALGAAMDEALSRLGNGPLDCACSESNGRHPIVQEPGRRQTCAGRRQ